MNAVTELSTGQRPDFPDEWYDVAGEELFWFDWRLRAFLAQQRALGVPLDAPWHGLDIGCGHGVTRTQLEHATAWTTDGADLNRHALDQNETRAGVAYYYDIHDRRPEFAGAYDFLILFDIMEHVAEPRAFVESALYHLKPGGLLFVNVPALNGLFSRYDEVVGHLRRYDEQGLRSDFADAPVEVLDLRFWGFSMLPYLVLRKLMSRGSGSRRKIIERGVTPPARWTEWPILQIMKLETRLLRNPVLGTSLLLTARKAATSE
jgi:SAM-dependent methyltransferase